MKREEFRVEEAGQTSKKTKKEGKDEEEESLARRAGSQRAGVEIGSV